MQTENPELHNTQFSYSMQEFNLSGFKLPAQSELIAQLSDKLPELRDNDYAELVMVQAYRQQPYQEDPEFSGSVPAIVLTQFERYNNKMVMPRYFGDPYVTESGTKIGNYHPNISAIIDETSHATFQLAERSIRVPVLLSRDGMFQFAGDTEAPPVRLKIDDHESRQIEYRPQGYYGYDIRPSWDRYDRPPTDSERNARIRELYRNFMVIDLRKREETRLTTANIPFDIRFAFGKTGFFRIMDVLRQADTFPQSGTIYDHGKWRKPETRTQRRKNNRAGGYGQGQQGGPGGLMSF